MLSSTLRMHFLLVLWRTQHRQWNNRKRCTQSKCVCFPHRKTERQPGTTKGGIHETNPCTFRQPTGENRSSHKANLSFSNKQTTEIEHLCVTFDSHMKLQNQTMECELETARSEARMNSKPENLLSTSRWTSSVGIKMPCRRQ